MRGQHGKTVLPYVKRLLLNLAGTGIKETTGTFDGVEFKVTSGMTEIDACRVYYNAREAYRDAELRKFEGEAGAFMRAKILLDVKATFDDPGQREMLLELVFEDCTSFSIRADFDDAKNLLKKAMFGT